jgi:hypothetical protein
MMFCRNVICKILPDIFAADKIGLLTAKSLRCADSEWQKHMSLPYFFIKECDRRTVPLSHCKIDQRDGSLIEIKILEF